MSGCAILWNMFERFTDRARRVLVLAREEARLLNHFIGAEHLLLGLLHEGEGVAAKALTLSGVRLETARENLEVTKRPADPATIMSPSFTPRAKKVLELSLRESMQLGCNYIDTEHVLLCLIRAGEGLAVRALHDLGVDLTRLRLTVFGVMAGGGPLANVEVSASGARRTRCRRSPDARFAASSSKGEESLTRLSTFGTAGESSQPRWT